jgi:restriction endonuclease S subunit
MTLTPTDPNQCDIKYLYYYLRLNNGLITKSNNGTTIPHCKWDSIHKVPVVIPPLEIQQEIVATLDRIYAPGTTELADTLKLTTSAMDLVLAQPDGATLEPIVEATRLAKKAAQMVADVKAQMVADVKAQMVAVMRSIDRRGFPITTLKDVCQVIGGKANYNRSDGNTVPYYDSNGVIGYVDTPLYTGEYIITARNLSIGAVHYINGPYYSSDHTINFTSLNQTVMSNKFFYYWLNMNNHKLKQLSSGIKPGIRKSAVEVIQMPLPPLDFQQQVVARMDALQSQVDALESLHQQSEDNARFILESYLGTSSASSTSIATLTATTSSSIATTTTDE